LAEKIPWIRNESFDPSYEFATPLDASKEELSQFEIKDEKEQDEPPDDDPHVNKKDFDKLF